jgi:hypothetical protein
VTALADICHLLVSVPSQMKQQLLPEAAGTADSRNDWDALWVVTWEMA